MMAIITTPRIVNNCFLLLVLWGCGASSPSWHVSHQQGSQTEFDSARLSYPTHDKVNGMAVEMVFAKKSFRTYLEVHSQLIPPYLDNPKDALVKITAAGQSTHGIAHRHQGGQRVTLPSQLHDTVIHHLLSGAPVTIELIGYKTTLEPHDFALFYQEAQKAPFNLPIQLPFKL